MIAEKWSINCPEGFEVDVSNYNFPPRHEQYVTCEGKGGYDNCPEGYVKSYHNKAGTTHTLDGYFGCVKLMDCDETKGEYKAWGGYFTCSTCYAGGCLDYAMSKKLGLGGLCRVNYKDPNQTPPCPPEDIQHRKDDNNEK